MSLEKTKNNTSLNLSYSISSDDSICMSPKSQAKQEILNLIISIPVNGSISKDSFVVNESIIKKIKKLFKIYDSHFINEYEPQLKKMEEKERNFIKKINTLNLQKESLEMKIKHLTNKENEYEKLKKKMNIITENGEIIMSDRKENEIIILRAENSNLKKLLEKTENEIKMNNLKIDEYKKNILYLRNINDNLSNEINKYKLNNDDNNLNSIIYDSYNNISKLNNDNSFSSINPIKRNISNKKNKNVKKDNSLLQSNKSKFLIGINNISVNENNSIYNNILQNVNNTSRTSNQKSLKNKISSSNIFPKDNSDDFSPSERYSYTMKKNNNSHNIKKSNNLLGCFSDKNILITPFKKNISIQSPGKFHTLSNSKNNSLSKNKTTVSVNHIPTNKSLKVITSPNAKYSKNVDKKSPKNKPKIKEVSTNYKYFQYKQNINVIDKNAKNLLSFTQRNRIHS